MVATAGKPDTRESKARLLKRGSSGCVRSMVTSNAYPKHEEKSNKSDQYVG